METLNPNITPEGNFTLTFFPDSQDAKPHTPLEEAIQYLFDCWEYEEEHNLQPIMKKRLSDVVDNVLLPACDEGNQDAIHWMYFAYNYGLGVKRDEEKALDYLKILAEYGYPDIQCELGKRYENLHWPCVTDEKAIGRNNRVAVQWFEKAAKQGYAEAMYLLGECFGEMYGVRHSKRKAFLWYKRAAERGHEEAMRELGLYYQRGIGVNKNLNIAAEWYDKAGLHDKARRLRNGEDDYAVNEDDWWLYSNYGFADDELPF